MTSRSSLRLRMPGRVFKRLAPMAERHLDQGSDIDLCEALADARVKPRGAGWSVFIPLDREQVRRLSYWIGASEPKFMREYRDSMREVAADD